MSWVLGAIFPKGNSREHAPSDPLLKTVNLAGISFLPGSEIKENLRVSAGQSLLSDF